MQRVFFLILLILFSVPSFLSAQVEKEYIYSIEEKVFHSETKEPLAFVNVQIENTSKGTASDETF